MAAVGTLTRWTVELPVPSVGGFALATFLINVSGAFVLGLAGVLLLSGCPTRYLLDRAPQTGSRPGLCWHGRTECRPPAGRPPCRNGAAMNCDACTSPGGRWRYWPKDPSADPWLLCDDCHEDMQADEHNRIAWRYAYIQTIAGSTAGQGELVLHGQDRLEGHWRETWAGWEPLPSDQP